MSRSLTARDRAGADAETLRKASLKRALVAIVALMALTAALWLVEGSETAAPQALPAAPAPAELPASEAASTAPAAPAAVEAAPVVAEQGAPAETGPTGETQSAPLPAEPPAATAVPQASPQDGSASAVPAAPSLSAAPSQTAEAPAASCNIPTTASAVTPGAPAGAPRLHAAAPPGPGFLIQLGVFLDTDNAEGMRRELERKGYPAHLQARVVLGPYPDRQSAVAAQEKIRRERKLDGMILPPRK